MSRDVTPAVLSSMLVRESSEGYIMLVTIDHSDIADGPIRLSSNATDMVSRGNTYLACPFKITLPSDSATQISSVQFSVQNVDRRIVLAVRSVTPGSEKPSLTLEIVTMDRKNTVEAGPFNFNINGSDWDKNEVTADISYEDFLNQRYPVGDMGPSKYQNLHR